ncbi:kinase-like protein [Tothia fuscella]|uniref:Kinase-like protein n=1 Tax=Tothia fuscella TaxID=1048955 RepID=A0A9P4NZF4_9PEZI|nr:kinase-like protein [Tothia fuscella]
MKGVFSALRKKRASNAIVDSDYVTTKLPRITRELLDTCERIGPNDSHIYRLNATTVVKVGDHVRLAEAHAMRYVRKNTSIPLPEVLDAYLLDDQEGVSAPHTCIVMTFVEGKTLDEEWPTYTDVEKANITSELKSYIAEMRTLRSSQIASVDGTYCNDQFFSDELGSYGPFESESAFKAGLAAALRAKGDNSWTEMIIKFIQSLPDGEVLLTHNDIAPRNILVKNAKVVAILDWENSGFYPEYWEYVKAMYWPDWQSPWITEGVVDSILNPYITELALLLHAREIIW